MKVHFPQVLAFTTGRQPYGRCSCRRTCLTRGFPPPAAVYCC